MMLIITLCSVIITLNQNVDSLSFCPNSLVFFKPFAEGTLQGSTLEKTGDKMGIMTGLRGETETKSIETVSFKLINTEATCEGNELTCRLI